MGSGVVAMASMLTQAALAKVVNIAAGRTGSVLCACLAQLRANIIFCLTAPHTVTYISSTATFFHHASSSVAGFLATDQRNV